MFNPIAPIFFARRSMMLAVASVQTSMWTCSRTSRAGHYEQASVNSGTCSCPIHST
jgi:hypothetical protein